MSAISEAGDPVSAAEEQPKLAPASKPKRRPTRVIKLRISGLAMSAESAAGARPSSPIPSGKTSAGKTSAGKTSEGRDASTAAGNRNVGGDAVQPASPSLVKPQGEATSPSAPSRERGRRIGLGVHLARLPSAALTGLVVLAGAALALPSGPADLSARLPHALSEVATVLQRAAGLVDGGAPVAIPTDAPGAPVEAQSDEAQVEVAPAEPAEPADAILSSPLPEAASNASGDAGPMTVRDAAPTSSPQEVQNDAQVTAKDEASPQPVDEVAGATLSEPAMDSESAEGGAASDERQTGNEAGLAVAVPAAKPLTTTADAPVASARDAEDIGEGAVTADRQAGDGADHDAAEPKAEPFTTAADAPVQAPEEVVAGTSSVSVADPEDAIEDATTTEPQARDLASRGAAEPKAEPTETSSTAPSVDEMVRVTAKRLNMRDRPATNAAFVGAFDRGTQLRAVDRDGRWVKAEAPDGRSGWLSARFLETLSDAKVAVEGATTTGVQAGEGTTGRGAERASEPFATAPTAPPAGEVVRVTAERLNMRDRPATNAAFVGAFDLGTELRVVDRDGRWVKAEAPDGRSGWLSARFLETLSDAKVAVEGATTTGVQAGEGTTGRGAERASEPFATAPTAPPAGEVVRVTAERLNMRDRPSTGASVVGAFDRGTQLTLLDRDGRWLKAQAPDGRSGWLNARFLETLSGDAAAVTEDPLAREATRLGAAKRAAEPVSSAAAALAAFASQVP